MLEWDAWNPDAGDSGDGPIEAYNVYDRISMMQIQTEAVTQDVISPISRLIQNLSPSTLYNFEVRPVREGPAEGTATRNVQIFTASLPTNPPPQPQVTTSSATSKTQVVADTTKPEPGVGTNMITVPKTTTPATSTGIFHFQLDCSLYFCKTLTIHK